ncbi:NAD(P)-dependent oxidoreductase [Pedobacter sp. SYSU D00535]|uniref:NAD(P)-dependent oxidoreductase n=1 Tax=Pedobacter sp. SYSU D00535 TaxID=2810308 RepID=UPI001A97CAC7|nr:SDR family oxidoreductase [Pedobacter sp. SYSU D00535]
MKVVIFGSTGSIGCHLTQQALDQGHTVTAFARSPEKLESLKAPNLHLFTGDVLEPDAVSAAIEGQDVVLCALGAGRRGKVRARGTEHIIKAMERHGVKRLICQTTLGCGESWGNLNFFWKRIMFGWFIKEAFQDHELQEKHIKQSNLEWTIIRPAAFTNAFKRDYKHGFSTLEPSLSLKIGRADVADFMLQQIQQTEYLRKTPALSY